MERRLTSGSQQPTSALARSLLGTVLVILLGFALTLAYARWALTPVERRAEGVMGNALPSAGYLAVARSALTDLEKAIQPLLFSQVLPAHMEQAIEAARDKLHAAVNAELETPEYPAEAALNAEVTRALSTLDARTVELLVSAHEADGVRAARTRAWLAAVEVADDAIARLARANIEGGEEEARSILGMERRAAAITFAMFGVTLAAAAVAAVLTLRLLRQTDREDAIHERFLRERADELEAFAGRVAHDLKDPLGALSVRLGALRVHLGGDPAMIVGSIDKAKQQVGRMDLVIVSLLDFARAGGQPAPGARAELQDAVAQVVDDFSPAAATEKVELSIDPFPPEALACNPGALGSVLHNLVGNALKYVAEGREPVRRICLHVEEQPGAVRVEVHDNGPGLPPGAEQIVFEPFVRLGQTRRAGTGLGLAIVRRIVEAHGGRVGVDSTPGAGSCFWFELPKAQAEA